MKCIIVEDETGAREHLEKQLRLSGFEIEVIARLDTVRSAIAWLQQNTADLIFLDIRLGDGDSLEIIDSMKLHIPFIFTTAYNKNYAISSRKVDALAYLLKPVKRVELIRALEKMTFQQHNVSVARKN